MREICRVQAMEIDTLRGHVLLRDDEVLPHRMLVSFCYAVSHTVCGRVLLLGDVQYIHTVCWRAKVLT